MSLGFVFAADANARGAAACFYRRRRSTFVENGHNRIFALQLNASGSIYIGWPTGNIPEPVAGGRSLLGPHRNEYAALFFVRVVSYHEPLVLRLCTAVHKSCSGNVWVNVQRKKKNLSASR